MANILDTKKRFHSEILCLTAATNALDTAADTGDDGQDDEDGSHNDDNAGP